MLSRHFRRVLLTALQDAFESGQPHFAGAPGIAEVVADKGYHSNETMVGFAAIGVRSYVSEPNRGRRRIRGASGLPSATIGRIRRGMIRRHANTDTRFSIDNQPLLPRAASSLALRWMSRYK